MINKESIRNHIVGIFTFLFLLFANQTIFAFEKQKIFSFQSIIETELSEIKNVFDFENIIKKNESSVTITQMPNFNAGVAAGMLHGIQPWNWFIDFASTIQRRETEWITWQDPTSGQMHLIDPALFGPPPNLKYESGFALGNIAGSTVAGIGYGVLIKAGLGALSATGVAKGGTQTVYRVFGGEAGALGKSWTPVNPNSIANYRNAAGLPSVNTGRFVIEGIVKESNILLKRSALPLNGNKGGLMEYIIKDPLKIKIIRVSGVNPEF